MGLQYVLLGIVILMVACVMLVLFATVISNLIIKFRERATDKITQLVEQRKRQAEYAKIKNQYED